MILSIRTLTIELINNPVAESSWASIMLNKAKQLWTHVLDLHVVRPRDHFVPNRDHEKTTSESSPAISPELMLDITVRAAQQQTGAAVAALALRKLWKLVCVARVGHDAPPLGTPLSAITGITGACMSAGKVMYCPDSETHALVDAEVCRALNIRSILVVPILTGENVAGLIEVWSSKTDAFNQTHVNWLIELTKFIQSLRGGANTPPMRMPGLSLSEPAPSPVRADEARLGEMRGEHRGLDPEARGEENEFDAISEILQKSVGNATWAQIRQQLASRIGSGEGNSSPPEASTGRALLDLSNPVYDTIGDSLEPLKKNPAPARFQKKSAKSQSA